MSPINNHTSFSSLPASVWCSQTLHRFAPHHLFSIPFVLPTLFNRQISTFRLSSPPPSKVLVFGSFTEDETRSWIKSISSESTKKPVSSSKRAGKPSEEKELLFGSFNLETGRVLGDTSNSEQSGHIGSTANGPAAFQTSIAIKKDDKVKIGKTPHHLLPGALQAPKENGNFKSSTNGSALSNGVSDIGLNSLQLSHNGGGHSYSSPSLKFSVLGGIKDGY